MDEANHRQHDQTPEEPAGWKYTPEDSAASSDVDPYKDSFAEDTPPPSSSDSTEIQWSASEFIAHQKNALWYAGLAVVAVVLGVLIFIVTRDFYSTGIICILVLTFAVAASLKPRVLTYHMGRTSLRVGTRVHPYRMFKAFAVIDEGAFSNIMLVPYKRFALPVNIYYPPEQEEAIVEALAAHLPMQPPSDDALDRFVRKVRF